MLHEFMKISNKDNKNKKNDSKNDSYNKNTKMNLSSLGVSI